MLWGFASQNNESSFAYLYRFTPLGQPENFRTMNGHAINTFKCRNKDGYACIVDFIIW